MSLMKSLLLTTAICATFAGADVVRAAVDQTVQTQPDALTKARTLLKKGEVGAAVVELKNLLRVNPKNAEARAELAMIYLRGNDGVSSEKEWRAALANGYPFEKAIDGLGLALLMQNQAPRLLKEYNAAKYTGELKARVHLVRAQAHMTLTELELAKQEVEAARAASPNSLGVRLASARLLQGDGDLKGADAQIDAALKLDPENTEALTLKGELKGAQGDSAGALTFFDRVLAKNSSDMRARIGRIASLVAQQKADAAEADVDELLKLAPASPHAAYFKALLLAQRGKKEEALAALGRAQGVDKLPPAQYLLAALHLGKGEVEQAQRYINAYVAKNPDDVRGQLLLVTLRLARGEVAVALPKLEALKAKLPNDYATSLLLGNAYLSVGRYADAAAQFQSASAASPAAPEATIGLAQSLLGQGKADQSAKILQTLAADGKGASRAIALLVVSFLQAKDYPGALKAVAAFQAKEPKNPSGPYLRASVNSARGDRAATRKDLLESLTLDPKFAAAESTLAQIDRAEGKREDAQKHYQNILGHTPASIEAHVGLATLAMDVADKKGAIDWLRKATTANPTEITPSLLVVNVLLGDGRAADALKEANGLAVRFPNNPLAYDALGLCQLANRDPKGAIASFTRLVALSPTSAPANIKLAAAYRSAQKNDDARKTLEAALKLDPASIDTHRALIDLTLATDGADAAVKKAQAAKAAIADKLDGDLVVADTLRAARKLPEAEAIYKTTWKVRPTAPLLGAYTQTLDAQGKFAQARTTIQEYLKKDPKDGTARFLLVVNSINLGDYTAALASGQALLKDRPKDVALLNNVAWLHDKTGNPQKAIELAESALTQAPMSGEVNDTLGWLLVRNGKLERGLALLKVAHELSPNTPDIAYHYAFALKESGKPGDARGLMTLALKSSQPFADRKDAEKFMQTLP